MFEEGGVRAETFKLWFSISRPPKRAANSPARRLGTTTYMHCMNQSGPRPPVCMYCVLYMCVCAYRVIMVCGSCADLSGGVGKKEKETLFGKLRGRPGTRSSRTLGWGGQTFPRMA